MSLFTFENLHPKNSSALGTPNMFACFPRLHALLRQRLLNGSTTKSTAYLTVQTELFGLPSPEDYAMIKHTAFFSSH